MDICEVFEVILFGSFYIFVRSLLSMVGKDVGVCPIYCVPSRKYSVIVV